LPGTQLFLGGAGTVSVISIFTRRVYSKVLAYGAPAHPAPDCLR